MNKIKLSILFSPFIIFFIAFAIFCPREKADSFQLIGAGVSVAAPTLKDSNTAASAGVYQVGRYANMLYIVGNFTAGSNYTLTSFDLYLTRVGTATGTLTPVIYATSAGAPTGSATTGTAVNRSTVDTSEGVVNFAGFTYSLTSGTEYCIGVYSSEVNGEEDIRVNFSSGGGTYANEMYNDADGTPAFSANNDEHLKFRSYGY